MQSSDVEAGPILRLFQVQAKPGCASELIDKFASTSAHVVHGEPGNNGYFFGQGVEHDGDLVIFASVWADMDAVKSRFGEDWRLSFLPPGYEALIENCTVRHFDIGKGWNVELTR